MVIQEAFLYGRPLLVSNIGGMEEKVVDGVNGLHVPVANADAWARSLVRASSVEQWSICRQGVHSPASQAECSTQHLKVLWSGAPGLGVPELR